MSVLLTLLCLHCLVAVVYYLVAMLSAMHGIRWALVGMVFGLFAAPLFVVHRHMHWRRCVGFGNRYLAA